MAVVGAIENGFGFIVVRNAQYPIPWRPPLDVIAVFLDKRSLRSVEIEIAVQSTEDQARTLEAADLIRIEIQFRILDVADIQFPALSTVVTIDAVKRKHFAPGTDHQRFVVKPFDADNVVVVVLVVLSRDGMQLFSGFIIKDHGVVLKG